MLTISVRFSWVSALLLCGAALVFSGCSDSSNVGLGVGPNSLKGGQPVSLNVNPELDTAKLVPRTGRNVTAPLTGNAPSWRFLVGRVDDPLPGTGVITADGYFDVVPPSQLPTRISEETNPDSITAELLLRPNYVHGDTASSVDIEVRELAEDAEMDQARADTSFPAGPLATETPVSINPNDSLVTIPLSEAWLADRLSALQQDSLSEFDGFKLTTGNSEDAVVGFSSQSAALQLTHIRDTTTADYTSSKTFTHVEQTGTPGSSLNTHQLLQDGVGTGLKMTWDFDSPALDTLKHDPLNRAQIIIPVDTTAMKANAGPPTFVRPFPQGFRILATRDSAPDTPSCSAVQAPTFSEEGRECIFPLLPSTAPGAAVVANNVAFPTFDLSFERIRQEPPKPPLFENVRLFINDRESPANSPQATIQAGLPSTLPILVAVDGEDPTPPRAKLTITPL